MRPHFLVLLLIPIVHGTVGRFNLFNPFRNILPSVQYYQLGGSDGFNDDRRQDNFQHNSHAPRFTTLLERCLAKSGFYIDGYCYLYVSTAVTWSAARDSCIAKGGVLWLPNLDDAYLYAKVVDATRMLSPLDFFASASNGVWVGIKSNNDLSGVQVVNHLYSLLINPPSGTARIPDCGVLGYGTGAFLLNNLACETNNRAYVCQIPI